jgi:hypothetical protein
MRMPSSLDSELRGWGSEMCSSRWVSLLVMTLSTAEGGAAAESPGDADDDEDTDEVGWLEAMIRVPARDCSMAPARCNENIRPRMWGGDDDGGCVGRYCRDSDGSEGREKKIRNKSRNATAAGTVCVMIVACGVTIPSR